MKQTDALLNKLMYGAGVETKKALASEMEFTETAFHKAYKKQSDYLFGRMLKLALKKDLDLNWVFSHSGRINQNTQEASE
jgi:hypothetical protein